MELTGECPKCGAPFYAAVCLIEGRIEEPQAPEPEADVYLAVRAGHDYVGSEDWNREWTCTEIYEAFGRFMRFEEA